VSYTAGLGWVFFGEQVMKIEIVGSTKLVVMFDEDEIKFIMREALANHLTMVEMFEMILAMLLVGGYSNIIGKG